MRLALPDAAHEQLHRYLLREAGLSLAQFRLLELLEASGGSHPSALARALGCTRGNVTALASRLAALGWIARRYPGRDRRRVWLELTPPGRRALEQARQAAHRFWAQWHARRRLASDPSQPLACPEREERWIVLEPPEPERWLILAGPGTDREASQQAIPSRRSRDG